MFSSAVAKAQAKDTAVVNRKPTPALPNIGNQTMLRRQARQGDAQPKLTVGRVDDPLEHEADRVADRVMRMPAPGVSIAPAQPVRVSRKCSACANEDGKLRAKSDGTAAAAGEAPATVHRVLGSPGRPLNSGARAFMEPRFGRGFGDVRVHTDADAAASAKDVRANAYTAGNHIVFGAGQYAPATASGRSLLAHELTHVLQQSAVSQIRRDPAPDEKQAPQAPQVQGAQGEEAQNPPDQIEEVTQGPGIATDQPSGVTPMGPAGPAVTPEITLETGNVGAGPINNLVHQQICVTGATPAKQCFSFAKMAGTEGFQAPEFSSTWLGWNSLVAGAILKGEVYHPSPVPGATIVSRHAPTAAQAATWLAYMTGTRLGLQDGYSVARHNCRLFSQWEFRDAPSHW